jgi:hypothetical protein
MKERARARIEERMVFERDNTMTLHESVITVLENWKQTMQEEALRAWDYFRGIDKIDRG